ncbi:hypothetical protein [Pseudonocardia humida]|uniref:Lipoprotein antigen n=1 Tax=Pseudonocardia humida TaxID=2800819 RepID=A0ABT0ZUC5_9PSEU|nr:hypothetical protein [Pseudonocardia humida]MCO1654342.1 hypothetical protein [Pseudonocardia humida]
MRTPARPSPSSTVTAALVALAAGALLAGCAGSPIPGSALPSAGGGTSPTAEPGPDGGPGPTGPAEARDREGACEVTLSGRGNIQVSGGGTRAVTRNGATSLGCGDGPLLGVEVQDGGVTFTPEGGRAVRIDSGQTAQVGDYEITVDEAAGDRAEFVVVPAA